MRVFRTPGALGRDGIWVFILAYPIEAAFVTSTRQYSRYQVERYCLVEYVPIDHLGLQNIINVHLFGRNVIDI